MKNSVPGQFHGIRAEIISHQVWESPANALIITLPQPSSILSSREGSKTIKAVCNCYLPESTWGSLHDHPDNWEAYLKAVLSEVNLSSEETTALSTGVNMEGLAWQEEAFDDLDAPVLRVTQADVPMPYNKKLEAWAKPNVRHLVEACKKVCYV